MLSRDRSMAIIHVQSHVNFVVWNCEVPYRAHHTVLSYDCSAIFGFSINRALRPTQSCVISRFPCQVMSIYNYACVWRHVLKWRACHQSLNSKIAEIILIKRISRYHPTIYALLLILYLTGHNQKAYHESCIEKGRWNWYVSHGEK